MNKVVLETVDITRRFGQFVAVDGVNIQVATGQIFGLLGSNGAGKTTMIKMLTTLLPPSAGTAIVAGFDIRRQAGHVRRAIGYVPQMLSADGNLTGYENLLIFAKLYDVPRAERASRIDEGLALMGLDDAGGRLVREYSGGMIRRLEIAQSMLHRPRVLFLDEPTVGLDPIARNSVWDRLRQLVADFNTTVFLTTHEMEEADALCDQIAILHRGAVAVVGSPASLKTSLAKDGATLDDVFVRYAGTVMESEDLTVMSHVLAAPLDASAEAGPLQAVVGFIYKTYVIAEFEIRKLKHDPTELVTRAVQPALWLLIFGEVFTRIRAIPTGGIPYLDFMAPGILAQSVLFVAIFYGIAVIWERDLGTIHKLLVSPTPRGALVLGKAVSAGARSLSQVVIVYTLAFSLGVRVNWNLIALLGVTMAVFVGAACFATLSLIIAAIVKTRERFMGIGQVLTMPLFFASNAIYPLAMMPTWLQAIARVNPLSYEVDALRALMVVGGSSAFGLWTDFGILAGTAALLVLIASHVYPRVVT